MCRRRKNSSVARTPTNLTTTPTLCKANFISGRPTIEMHSAPSASAYIYIYIYIYTWYVFPVAATYYSNWGCVFATRSATYPNGQHVNMRLWRCRCRWQHWLCRRRWKPWSYRYLTTQEARFDREDRKRSMTYDNERRWLGLFGVIR